MKKRKREKGNEAIRREKGWGKKKKKKARNDLEDK